MANRHRCQADRHFRRFLRARRPFAARAAAADASSRRLPYRASDAVVFESPTVAGLAEQLIVNETQAGQTQQIAAALESVDDIGDAENVARVLTEGVTVTRQGGMTLRKPDEPLVLSYGQLRLWVLDQLLPGTPYYNMPGTLRLRGRSTTRLSSERCRPSSTGTKCCARLHVGGRRTDPGNRPRLAFELPLIDLTNLPEAGESGPPWPLRPESSTAVRSRARAFDPSRASSTFSGRSPGGVDAPPHRL